MGSWQDTRQFLGILAKDLPRYLRALWLPGGDYLALRNRNEALARGPDGKGFQCMWQWTSQLHAAGHIPALGRAMLRRAHRVHPVRRMAKPAIAGSPQLTFVIGHRGLDRLPHLCATLESIAGQAEVPVECIVVEQDHRSLLPNHLPEWVRYVHTPPPEANLPYCRSWAFNVGALRARSDVLVLHDNDILLPSNYAAQMLGLVRQGFEVINLKRFVFYLTEEHTRAVLEQGATVDGAAPLSVVQNAQGGGSVGVTREAYEAIGGFHEAFVGWGGEDVEFWERAASRRVWPYAFLPVFHLWHPPQPNKDNQESSALKLYYSLSQIPVDERISGLLASHRGALSGPAPCTCAPPI